MKRILITGGAGFIGCNLANKLLSKKNFVKIYDNLSRFGTKINLKWLKEKHKSNLEIIIGDIRNAKELNKVVKNIDIVYHLASQVAVTSSIKNPKEDFEINAVGTLNLLESLRKEKANTILIFTSTNKVYGEMKNIPLVEKERRYAFKDLPEGISEEQNLDFHSPYGCSKGTAEQYVRDYSRIYDLRTVVFRMSCIYGIRQMGNEDQGWIAHFLISSLLRKPITIYGNGKQVRDILYIDDLISAFELVVSNIKTTNGMIYNIGGGKDNTISLLELIDEITTTFKIKVKLKFKEWRAGDQKVYISNIKKAYKDFNWKPKINKNQGIQLLFDYLSRNIKIFKE